MGPDRGRVADRRSTPALVRRERPEDAAAVRRVNELAFGQAAEANLVDKLRARGAAALSLVAERAGEIVGHVLFSPVTAETPGSAPTVVALGPMAVTPAAQRRGIGSLLVARGLAECREAGHGGVVVLGHAEYYPRFGFVPASRHGITCRYDVPDEVFMALELRPGGLAGSRGRVRYAPEFDEV